tara:strand:+ start:15197 stop:16108 length:912 start_codon:yes stop_codon:yes gene_type:complete
MAYQNISVPRIYCNIADFLLARGEIGQNDNKLRTLPVEPQIYGNNGDLTGIEWFPDFDTDKKFIALLGNDALNKFKVYEDFTETSEIQGDAIINDGGALAGFTIHKLNGIPKEVNISDGSKVGSYVLGYYYDFPHSPDLSLSVEYMYDGHKETTTRGGNTIVNSYYSGPSKWGDLGAWELGDDGAYTNLYRTGRRRWRLTFSFMADSSIWGKNLSLSNLSTPQEDSADTSADTLLFTDTFFRVLQFTNGSQLPFIFQIDNNVASGEVAKPDQFAIAKFDSNNFNITQTAPNMYSCSLSIKEIW